jgi:hypothetical protein
LGDAQRFKHKYLWLPVGAGDACESQHNKASNIEGEKSADRKSQKTTPKVKVDEKALVYYYQC